jgi:hypothetical protein
MTSAPRLSAPEAGQILRLAPATQLGRELGLDQPPAHKGVEIIAPYECERAKATPRLLQKGRRTELDPASEPPVVGPPLRAAPVKPKGSSMLTGYGGLLGSAAGGRPAREGKAQAAHAQRASLRQVREEPGIEGDDQRGWTEDSRESGQAEIKKSRSAVSHSLNGGRIALA